MSSCLTRQQVINDQKWRYKDELRIVKKELAKWGIPATNDILIRYYHPYGHTAEVLDINDQIFWVIMPWCGDVKWCGAPIVLTDLEYHNLSFEYFKELLNVWVDPSEMRY